MATGVSWMWNYVMFCSSSWMDCTCCLAGRQYTIGFLRFCKQVLSFTIFSLCYKFKLVFLQLCQLTLKRDIVIVYLSLKFD